MKRLLTIVSAAALMLCGTVTNANAQGLLKKVSKAAESVTSTTSSSESTIDTEALAKAMPDFTFKKVQVTDENGNVETNDDGTPRYRVLIYDKLGNATTATLAKKQIKSVMNSSIVQSVLKTGATAGIGALSGGGKGALVGAGAGLAASSGDIVTIVNQVKELKAFNKQLDVYQKNFTDEGLPVDATTDVTSIKGLDLAEAEEATVATATVQEQLSTAKEMEDGDVKFDDMFNNQ